MQQHPWGTLFSVRGDVDHLEGRRLFDDLYRGMNGPIVIDVSGLEYIDTGGIAAIMEILKHVRARQGLLVIAAPNPHIKEIFNIAGFPKLAPWLVMTASVDEAAQAVEAWKRGQPS